MSPKPPPSFGSFEGDDPFAAPSPPDTTQPPSSDVPPPDLSVPPKKKVPSPPPSFDFSGVDPFVGPAAPDLTSPPLDVSSPPPPPPGAEKKGPSPPPSFDFSGGDPFADPFAPASGPDKQRAGSVKGDRRDGGDDDDDGESDRDGGGDDGNDGRDRAEEARAEGERNERVRKHREKEGEKEKRITDKIRPAVQKVAAAARAAGSPQVFVGDFEGEPGRVVVVIKTSGNDYIDFGQAIGEEDVKLVPGDRAVANMGSKEVSVPRNLTRADFPFLAREILRVVTLGKEIKTERKEMKGKKQGRHVVIIEDYVEDSDSVLFGKEAKKRRAYCEKLSAIRGEWKDRPFNAMRDEYLQTERDYLAAIKDSEERLDGMMVSVSSRFQSEAGFSIYESYNGTNGFKIERRRRLQKAQENFITRYDKEGSGLLTGVYTPETPKARITTGWDMVPVVAAVRRMVLDEGTWQERLFVDPMRRLRRTLWDGSETVQNLRFHKIIEANSEEDGNLFKGPQDFSK